MTRRRIITTTVEQLQEPKTLSGYLAGRFTYFAQNEWRREISGGKLSVDGAAVTDPGMLLKGGETLAWDGSGIIEPEVDRSITVLYEDQWLVAVNKTGNLPVHPAGRYFNHTLTALLADRYGRKVYPVHRIDRETSGIVLLAFDNNSVQNLTRALASGTKDYLALVQGIFPDEELIIDLPLGRDTDSAVAKKRRAWPGGNEHALTRFRKILSVGEISLVRCFPQTGRLHQIRAHLAAAGYPIVGDKLYGRDETAFLKFIKEGFTAELQASLLLPRQALHAARLAFIHPQTGKKLILRAPLPKLFANLLRSGKEGQVKAFPARLSL
ncbi:MAG: RluA family pseudouridine synthase [Deltaproteobacteria bacterium]|nr:RluA family pseudouridine synthase [Deltaproteobacteria bacterium]